MEFGVFIPIIALMIPVSAIVIGGLIRLQRLRIEERAVTGGGAEVEALRGEVDSLRQEVAELQERVDFTERLLATERQRGQLGEGR